MIALTYRVRIEAPDDDGDVARWLKALKHRVEDLRAQGVRVRSTVEFIGSVVHGTHAPCAECAQPWGACECAPAGAHDAGPSGEADALVASAASRVVTLDAGAEGGAVEAPSRSRAKRERVQRGERSEPALSKAAKAKRGARA